MVETVAAVGAAAPDFVLGESEGRETTLGSLRGHPVVLAFSSTEWNPTRELELETYNAIVAGIPGAHARLLRISTDGMWRALDFDGENIRVPMLSGLDSSGEVARAFGVDGTDALVVIDARGVIRWRHVGSVTGQPDIDALIASLTSMAPDPLAPRSLFAGEGETAARLTPSRREFVATTLAAASLVASRPLLARAEPFVARLAPAEAGTTANSVTLAVNGRTLTLAIEPRVTLLDALREYAGLTGTKKGCDHGQCGACTVHINGRRQLSCMTFAMMHQRDQITTVEGLASNDTLHPMQAAFIKHDGFQCGYCTPGQLMSATALLKEPCGPADIDVRECMSGNICRCGAYPGIVAAIQEVRTTTGG